MGKKKIFISYRRDGGFEFAKQLYEMLTKDNYRVNFDRNTFVSGNFKPQIYRQIDQSRDFILVVDRYAFDRTLDPDFDPEHDWMRKELAYAIKKKKNIIPIFLESDLSFPRNLPGDIKEVAEKTTLIYDHYTPDEFYKALKTSFIRSPQKVGPLGWAFIIIGTLIMYAYVTNQNNNQISYPQDAPQVAEVSLNTSASDIVYIIHQFFSYSRSWDVFAANEALIPQGDTKYDDTHVMEYSCRLTYDNRPLIPDRMGDARDWRVFVIGKESHPQYLIFKIEGVLLEPRDMGEEIANDLNLSMTFNHSTDQQSYYALYENSEWVFLFYAEVADKGNRYVLQLTTSDLRDHLIDPKI